MSGQPVSPTDVERNQRAITQPSAADSGIDLTVVDGEHLGQRLIRVGTMVATIKAGLEIEFHDAHKVSRRALVEAATDAAVAAVRDKWARHWTYGHTPLNEAFSTEAVWDGLADHIHGTVTKTDEAFRQVARVATAYALGQVNVWAAQRQTDLERKIARDIRYTESISH